MEITEIKPVSYELRLTISEDISKKTGISKQKVSEILADEFMKLLGLI